MNGEKLQKQMEMLNSEERHRLGPLTLRYRDLLSAPAIWDGRGGQILVRATSTSALDMIKTQLHDQGRWDGMLEGFVNGIEEDFTLNLHFPPINVVARPGQYLLVY